MKKVIYFFSGTGNSLRAARIIADELKDTGIVNVRNDPSGYSAEDAEVIGFAPLRMRTSAASPFLLSIFAAFNVLVPSL